MFKHLLVPLDGSTMAESALAPAAQLAERMGAAVTLVHVIEKNAPARAHGERHITTVGEAEEYLREIARRPVFAGSRVGVHVHSAEVADVAASISAHTEELSPDLIVMTAHGRGGARRLIFGAIAQQVIAMGETPVLLARESPQQQRPPRAFRSILAPIDGDPAHERGLPAAVDIARSCTATLHLLMVVPTPGALAGSRAETGRLLPSATRVLLDMDSADARRYVAARAAELSADGLIVEGECGRGDPARVICRAAERMSADLVVMGTHGRAGSGAFWAGSVAARVVSRTRSSLLLWPTRDEG